MMNNRSHVQVKPLLIFMLRATLSLSVFLMLVSAFLFLSQWRWLFDENYSSAFLLLGLLLILTASASFWIYKKNFTKSLYRILFLLNFILLTCFSYFSCQSWPLPYEIKRIKQEVLLPDAHENLVPVYFWDFASWYNVDGLKEIDIVVPYEKGPPKKLLSKIYFQNKKTQKIELELHGKRPRQYPLSQIRSYFDGNMIPFSQIKRFAQLAKESGLIFGQKIPMLYLIELDSKDYSTFAVGIPWQEAIHNNNSLDGRVFFSGPGGSVFQARCDSPCRFSRFLELIQFPNDPSGSFSERHAWVVSSIKKLLSSPPQDPDQKERYEKLLSLYLVSYLTLDPRDPEAFFHLGKLSRNKTTLLSAIQYGKDLGLEPAKILELKNLAGEK